MKKKSLVIAIIGVVAVAGAAWFYFSDTEMLGWGTPQDNSGVAARVNGEDITRVELGKYEEQVAVSQGLDIASLGEDDRASLQEQALDTLISRLLVKQAAAKAGITVADADVDGELEGIKGQFESNAAYQEALSQEGLTESSLRSRIAADMVIQSYIEQTLDLDSITATEEEIEAEYELAASQNEGFPELSEVRDQIESSILQEKQQQMITAHIQGLHAEAEVEVLI
jgi:FKBP-type peptidyl-prolyl cis-trans isomerase (trigger factor)